VLRAYSPVTTIGGGVVAEPVPPKRNRLEVEVRGAVEAVLDGRPAEALAAALDLAGWAGVQRGAAGLVTGLLPADAAHELDELENKGVLRSAARAFGPETSTEARELVLRAVTAEEERDALRPAVPLATVRAALPSWAHPDLADATIEALVAEEALESGEGGVRSPGFTPTLTADQEKATRELLAALSQEELAPPFLDELPVALRDRPDFRSIVLRLEGLGEIRSVADGLYVRTAALDDAARRITTELGGRSNLGPSDFRDVLGVTRKHLIPLLNYFDGTGVTLRDPDGRAVPAA
jgi:selenocysteine-specific elongation factor